MLPQNHNFLHINTLSTFACYIFGFVRILMIWKDSFQCWLQSFYLSCLDCYSCPRLFLGYFCMIIVCVFMIIYISFVYVIGFYNLFCHVLSCYLSCLCCYMIWVFCFCLQVILEPRGSLAETSFSHLISVWSSQATLSKPSS